MKHLLLAFLLVAGAAASSAQKAAEIAVTQAAQKSVDAFMAGGYDKFVTFMPQRLVTAMGGKETMVATLQKGMGDAHIKAVQLGEPGPMQKFGDWLISLVPEKLTIDVPAGQLTSESYLIGISEDHGKNWVFADSSAFTRENEAQLAQIFPEFAGKLTIPPKKEDVFKAR